MSRRLPYLALLAASIFGWWVSDHVLVPWIGHASGYDRIQARDLSVVLGHWVFDQLPRVLVCAGIWWVAWRRGMMPSLRQSLGSGGSWGRVAVTGAVSSAILLAATVGIGFAAGGTFGFHPYVPKMLGDLVSNLYEEIVYRGLMFSSFYGVAAAASFPLVGKPNRGGLLAGVLGSSFIFAAGHDQYDVALRIVLGVFSSAFAFAWIRARSLWAPWIPHTVVDVIGDSILKL